MQNLLEKLFLKSFFFNFFQSTENNFFYFAEIFLANTLYS